MKCLYRDILVVPCKYFTKNGDCNVKENCQKGDAVCNMAMRYFMIIQPSKLAEIVKLIHQMDQAIVSGMAYFWMDDIKETVECVALGDYHKGGEGCDEPQEDYVVDSFLPYWEKLKEILVGNTNS